MVTDEIASSFAKFFDRHGPSGDELTRHFQRYGLEAVDPSREDRFTGKMKRVRSVLNYAVDNDPDAGDKLIWSLLGALKASGSFRTTSPDYAGDEVISAAKEAFRTAGYELDFDGNLRATLLEGLEGSQVTGVLETYVRRAQLGSQDAALVVGTSKDLLEATARHVLVQMTGSYPAHDNFQTTLFQAFDRAGLATAFPMLQQLDKDPERAIQQCLYLLGNAVNRLRNEDGTGHGRPFPPSVSHAQGKAAIRAMALVSQALLDALEPKAASKTA